MCIDRSGLEQDDMRIMYKYLTTSLFPAHLENELQGTQPRTVGAATQGTSHFAK